MTLLHRNASVKILLLMTISVAVAFADDGSKRSLLEDQDENLFHFWRKTKRSLADEDDMLTAFLPKKPARAGNDFARFSLWRKSKKSDPDSVLDFMKRGMSRLSTARGYNLWRKSKKDQEPMEFNTQQSPFETLGEKVPDDRLLDLSSYVVKIKPTAKRPMNWRSLVKYGKRSSIRRFGNFKHWRKSG